MDIIFSQIKKMDVVCVSDGKNLGRVFDVAFCFPEGAIKGFYVTGCKGFKLTKSEEFIALSNVVKIGEDVILVKGVGGASLPQSAQTRRNYEEYE